jgi:IS30 family transposase
MKLTEQPKGRTFLSQEEKNTILRMRLLTYSIKQISEHTGRSRTTVKRIIYGW